MQTIRSQFPLLDQSIHGKPLIYLDSAATSQKPQIVIDAEKSFYETINAGAHRSSHELASRATVIFERARAQVAHLVGAHTEPGKEEIIFTAGATASFNLLANSFYNASTPWHHSARFALHAGDEIVVSRAEHHSVLLPFQELCYKTGATLRWFDVDRYGSIQSETADSVITPKTRIVAITGLSNVTGALTHLEPIIQRAHDVGALVVLDACQLIPHRRVNVHQLDVDFMCWSAHKAYGPSGVGFLYGKRDLLNELPPSQFGGSMVEAAWLDKPAEYAEPPYRFEAGTQPLAQVASAGIAAEWYEKYMTPDAITHEHVLTTQLLAIADIPGVKILGRSDDQDRVGTVSFEIEGVHPHDVSQFLDSYGIEIRSGHHCAQPIHRFFHEYASNRVSPGIYNTEDEVKQCVDAIAHVRPYFLGVH